MKEIYEFRIVYKFSSLLFGVNEGKNLGQVSKSIKIVHLTKEDPRFDQIPIVDKFVNEKYNRSFFMGWSIIRNYTKRELDNAKLLFLKITNTFEPCGEENGTMYDESSGCKICGATRQQISPLFLNEKSLPNKDISISIAGEVLVSKKFKENCDNNKITGISFEKIYENRKELEYFQLFAKTKIELSQKTILGINPFDFSGANGNEIYNCPNGDTIGLNILSQPIVVDNLDINSYDFFSSTQMIGVKRGLLRPQPIYFCSQRIRELVKKEQLKGFDFEPAVITS